MTVWLLGLWVLAGVGAVWVVTLSRILTARREADERRTWFNTWVLTVNQARNWDAPSPWTIRYGDTVPGEWRS